MSPRVRPTGGGSRRSTVPIIESTKGWSLRNTLNAAARGCAAAALWALASCGGGSDEPHSAPPRAPDSVIYVTNVSSSDVSIHAVDGDTGTLGAAQAAAPAGTSPVAIAVHPSGRFLYVANFQSCDISAYAIDAVTGALTPIGSPISTGAGKNPLFISVHPSGRFAYVATLLDNPVPGKVTPYAIDATTGALRALDDGAFAGNGPSSIAFTPNGNFAYVADFLSDVVWALAVDTSTGALTDVAPNEPTIAGFFPASVAVDGRGRFAYVVNRQSGDVMSFAIAASGRLAQVGDPIAAGVGPTFVALHPSGKFAYVVNLGSDDISTYAIDAVSGALSPAGPTVPTGDQPRSIAFEPSGRFAYVVNQDSEDISVYVVDAATGALSSAGDRVATGQQPSAMAIVTRMP